jgi:hypothetical protein
VQQNQKLLFYDKRTVAILKIKTFNFILKKVYNPTIETKPFDDHLNSNNNPNPNTLDNLVTSSSSSSSLATSYNNDPLLINQQHHHQQHNINFKSLNSHDPTLSDLYDYQNNNNHDINNSYHSMVQIYNNNGQSLTAYHVGHLNHHQMNNLNNNDMDNAEISCIIANSSETKHKKAKKSGNSTQKSARKRGISSVANSTTTTNFVGNLNQPALQSLPSNNTSTNKKIRELTAGFSKEVKVPKLEPKSPKQISNSQVNPSATFEILNNNNNSNNLTIVNLPQSNQIDPTFNEHNINNQNLHQISLQNSNLIAIQPLNPSQKTIPKIPAVTSVMHQNQTNNSKLIIAKINNNSSVNNPSISNHTPAPTTQLIKLVPLSRDPTLALSSIGSPPSTLHLTSTTQTFSESTSSNADAPTCSLPKLTQQTDISINNNSDSEKNCSSNNIDENNSINNCLVNEHSYE